MQRLGVRVEWVACASPSGQNGRQPSVGDLSEPSLVTMSEMQTARPRPDDRVGAGARGLERAAALFGEERPEFLRNETLAEIFSAAVAAAPDRPALRTPSSVMTYAELDRAARRIAAGLLARGARPGMLVGLWMPRGPELLTAQIAIALTGAAWLPFDADAPAERVALCLADGEAILLVTTNAFAATFAAPPPCPAVSPAGLAEGVDEAAARAVNARAAGAGPDDPAYMIYTSGSTGTPKGIVITGRNICHYLRSANHLYRIEPRDVVFQGASVAFDLSMEEIWIPYLVGASLFVASREMMGEADALPDVMSAAGVTVLDTVPTLLGLLTRDIPSLRLIILGGEACPPSLGQRWCRPGRLIVNSYGPTETTVVATAAIVEPGEPVTIGGPIANYTCYVVDETLELVGRNVEGELLIGGPGVARGYLKRDQLTREKFIANPFGATGGDPVLYRSGDAVMMDDAGRIHFRGRIDDQVKIRGFRVELGEIEAKLADLPEIAQAAVVLRTDDGLDQLVAFLVPAGSAAIDSQTLRTRLRDLLPPYMVPARFETLEALPRLSSGKVDRNALKRRPLAVRVAEAQEEPRDPIEAALLTAAKRVLPAQPIPFDADFFTDLGGHSLLAARFVSVVREDPALATLTLQDMYKARSLRGMAQLMTGRAGPGTASRQDLRFEPPPLLRRFFCGLAQAAVLVFILSLTTAQWLGVFVSYMLVSGTEASLFDEAVYLIGVYMIINVLTVALAIASKWVILGRMKPGRYPLWGVYFFRWWFVQRMISLTHPKWFQGSPVMRLFLMALGAKVGKDAIIGDHEVGAPDLLVIGPRASIGGKVVFANARVEGNEFIVGPIAIGADAYVGTSCVLENDVTLGDGAEIADLTAIAAGTTIGANESWDGSPGRRVGRADGEAERPFPKASEAKRWAMGFVYVALLLLVPPLGLVPIFPAFWLFDQLDNWLSVADVDRTAYLTSLPILAWPASFAMVIFTVAFIAAIRWIVLPRVKEGDYSVFSWFYLRKWSVALATEVTLDVLTSLFATIYMRAWYRLMGAKIGKDAEISTNLAGRYDLVEIGEKCFIADEVVLGDEEVRHGWMKLRRVKTEARVFVGNDAVVPIGTTIPEGALIGIKSKPPAHQAVQPGETWFGTPPIRLPVRQRFESASIWTYEAPRWKKLARAVFEAVHISLPTMLFIVFGTWSVEWLGPKVLDGDYLGAALQFVAAAVGISVAMTLIVVAIKWLTMGRYEPVVKPMWSWWAMRTEAVAVMYWGMAGRVLIEHLRGTPFLPWVLRLFGTKLGRGCYLDMTDITEFDCVTVGDFVSINAFAALQTHLYEDRVMKVGRVRIGDGVTIGAGSTVLYDTHVGDYARLGPLTLVMKGESIPPDSAWTGSPAEPVVARTDAPALDKAA